MGRAPIVTDCQSPMEDSSRPVRFQVESVWGESLEIIHDVRFRLTHERARRQRERERERERGREREGAGVYMCV